MCWASIRGEAHSSPTQLGANVIQLEGSPWLQAVVFYTKNVQLH